MNIVLFEQHELQQTLSPSDYRVQHVREVLSVADGQSFDAGIINGMRGKARFETAADVQLPDRLKIHFEPTKPSAPLYPVDVVIGISRPQTCRFVLRSLATLGVRSIEFVLCAKGQPSYASSKLWTSGEYIEIVRAAVAQSFETNLPHVRCDRKLFEAIESVDSLNVAKVCLDNYESTASLVESFSRSRSTSSNPDSSKPATTSSSENSNLGSTCLLIGSERGWSDEERAIIRDSGFTLASLGTRVLRVETAAVAAVSALLAQRYWINESGTTSTR